MVPLTARFGRAGRSFPFDDRAACTSRARSAAARAIGRAAITVVPGGSNRMSRLKGALLCAAAATLISAPAGAQITGHPLELSAGAGIFQYDVRAYTRT